MATTSVSVPRGTTWTLLGATPCSVSNPGPGQILVAVDTTLPTAGTRVGVPLPAGEVMDIGLIGQNAYGLPFDVGVGAGEAIPVTVVR